MPAHIPARIPELPSVAPRARRQRLTPAAFLLSLATLVLSSAAALAHAQEIHLDEPRHTADVHAQRVTVDESTQAIAAGKAEWIELRFHVQPGFHINSHNPHDDLLIPTTLAFPGSDPLRILQTVYPTGEPLRLDIGAGEILSTYSSDFRVRLQVFAAKGDTTSLGSLHYQACNAASCFPARDLPVRLAVSAR